VEGNPDELDRAKDTLKSLGLTMATAATTPPAVNGKASIGTGTVEWEEEKARKFLKALEDYPSHKKIFYTVYDAKTMSYDDLLKQAGMSSDELKAALASITKIARRDGNKELRAMDWQKENPNPGVWEVVPPLRKIIEDHKLR
jgi:uncharacterized ferredoxin-like protein